jgi:cytidine deaminase
MKDKLIKLLDNSYSPYSKFRVGAIVVMKDGCEFNGVNVENASYGASICAERSAILSAISNGYKKGDFKELHIMCDSQKIGMPCFNCRMVISELFDLDCNILAYNNLGDVEIHTVKELCPYPFSEENLK